jgi:signal transduction histidine kinase
MSDPRDASGIDGELLAPGLLHEMRQPLMGILAGLEILSRKLRCDAGAAKDLQLVQAQALRLHEMFRTYDDLLRGAVERAPFEVDAAVKHAADLLSFRVHTLGERFAIVEGNAIALGTHNALLHAVTNLLVNALDAVETNQGRVQVRVLPDAAAVEVRVSDEGIGIPPDLKPLLFQKRFTTKPGGRGSGLGLAIARTMLERSGATLRLVEESDPLRLPWAATEFAIRLEAAGGAR